MQIQDCYERLIAADLVRDPRDAFLVHLKLFWFKFVTRRPGWASHLRRVLLAPHLLAQEIAFWTTKLSERKRLFNYYFSK
jgi:hypothetical protein